MQSARSRIVPVLAAVVAISLIALWGAALAHAQAPTPAPSGGGGASSGAEAADKTGAWIQNWAQMLVIYAGGAVLACIWLARRTGELAIQAISGVAVLIWVMAPGLIAIFAEKLGVHIIG
jgi:hypothetical protein